jgi:hypothetical protein
MLQQAWILNIASSRIPLAVEEGAWQIRKRKHARERPIARSSYDIRPYFLADDLI